MLYDKKPMISCIAVGHSEPQSEMIVQNLVKSEQHLTYLALLVHLFVVGRFYDFGKLGSTVPVMKMIESISMAASGFCIYR